MRYLLFSDIHSNLEALEAILDDAGDKETDATLCLGDFVGYGANPEECVQTFLELSNVTAVLGNHDAAVVHPGERSFFNPVARAGIIYSEENLSPESGSFLKELPLTSDMGSHALAVHASPYNPESWIYVLDPLEVADAFHVLEHSVAFIGHTHFPAIHANNGTSRPFAPGDRIRIDTTTKMLINVGSVGQPRDGDPRAAYVVFDDETLLIEMFRVEYDVEAAARKIVEAGLPPMLADRIRRGY